MFLNYGFVKWLLLSNYLVPGRLDFFKKNWIFTVIITIGKDLKGILSHYLFVFTKADY